HLYTWHALYILYDFLSFLFFFRTRPPPRSTLFPYTTLFRSHVYVGCAQSLARSRGIPNHASAHNRSPRGNFRHFAARTIHSPDRSEEHTSELQSRFDLVCRLMLEKKKKTSESITTTFRYVAH